MSTPAEQARAIGRARDFLRRVGSGDLTGEGVAIEAASIWRHFPTDADFALTGAAIADATKGRSNDRTHYVGCWRAHGECAAVEIARLAADIRETLGALEGQGELVERLKGALERLGPTC